MTDETNSLTRLEEALGRLGAEHEPPKGWEDRVLDVVDKAKDAAELAASDRPEAAVTDPSELLPLPGTGEAAPAIHEGAAQAPDAADAVVAAHARDVADAVVAAHARDVADAVVAAHARDVADAVVAASAADAAVPERLALRRRRRWLTIAAVEAVGIAAAGACIVLGLASPDLGRSAQGQLELAVAWEPVGPTLRRGSNSAHVGDVVHAKAAGGLGHRALWVYHDDRLVLVCPGPHDCRDGRDATIADVVLRAQGTYMFVAVTSTGELPVPRGQFDSDVAGANVPGVMTKTSRLDAR
jgi:hypothetical protein